VPALAARGQIQPITKAYRLDDAPQARADLRDGRIVGGTFVRP
jgi:D-arabinose 1-dehydrogenase-like Zn-dependent alcohol dehydrogenase